MNKYTILVWAFGLFIGLFFYQKGNLFKNKWLYMSAMISLLTFLPNLIWQKQNKFPLLKHSSDNHNDHNQTKLLLQD
ncbi:glycosyltransferase family 39 protein [bacterium]|nr:glycosyltransferase family 39 protein [bacterium]